MKSAAGAPPITKPADGVFSGQSGSIGWKVSVVWRETIVHNREVRWHYTITLEELAGIAVDLERAMVRTAFEGSELGLHERTLRVRLGPREHWSDYRWSSVFLRASAAGRLPTDETVARGKFEVWERILGRDSTGRPVVVDLRFYPDDALTR